MISGSNQLRPATIKIVADSREVAEVSTTNEAGMYLTRIALERITADAAGLAVAVEHASILSLSLGRPDSTDIAVRAT